MMSQCNIMKKEQFSWKKWLHMWHRNNTIMKKKGSLAEKWLQMWLRSNTILSAIILSLPVGRSYMLRNTRVFYLVMKTILTHFEENNQSEKWN